MAPHDKFKDMKYILLKTKPWPTYNTEEPSHQLTSRRTIGQKKLREAYTG
jgi:hypothetical protein